MEELAVTAIAQPRVIHYPDDDGLPMSDNTVQFEWISIIKWNLEATFRDRPDVFVAGNHLIYPVEGNVKIRQAPDVYVAFGPKKGDRGSYKVWEEGVFPQIVFEVWSPSNLSEDMENKKDFYERYGAEEYYIVYPPFPAHAEGWTRKDERFAEIAEMDGWVSPRLGMRFKLQEGNLRLYGPDGREFLAPSEIAAERDAAEQRAERFAAKLRELGIDPDSL